jgi:hypothetical protein
LYSSRSKTEELDDADDVELILFVFKAVIEQGQEILCFVETAATCGVWSVSKLSGAGALAIENKSKYPHLIDGSSGSSSSSCGVHVGCGNFEF